MRHKIKIDLKNNAFDFVRLLFSLFVVYAHSRYLYGAEDLLHWTAKDFGILHVGSMGLWGFFAISGFLVTTSWSNSKGAADFFLKRFKRIFPGFWVSLLVCGLFFAPLWYAIKVKTLNGFIDLYALHVWQFITFNFNSTITVQSIGNITINAVNGPLWTIRHEINAYILLGIMLGLLASIKSSIKIQSRVILALTLLLSAVRLLYTYNSNFSNSYSQWFGDARFLLFLVIFMWGATINFYKDLLMPHWPGSLASITILIVGTKFDFLPIVFPFCFSYLVISLCFAIPLRNISKKIGDLSFGIYLYHWPVRLTLQMLGFQESLGLWSFIGLNLILTIPLAYLSWNFVEKRFLSHAKTQNNPNSEPTACPNHPALN